MSFFFGGGGTNWKPLMVYETTLHLEEKKGFLRVVRDGGLENPTHRLLINKMMKRLFFPPQMGDGHDF